MKNFIKKFTFLIAILAIFSTTCTIAQSPIGPQEKIKSVTHKEDVPDAKLNIVTAQIDADTSITVPVIDQFPSGEGLPGIISWFLGNWNRIISLFVILLFVIESILSIFPTAKNISVFQNIREFLDRLLLFRNNKSGGGIFQAKTEIKESGRTSS